MDFHIYHKSTWIPKSNNFFKGSLFASSGFRWTFKMCWVNIFQIKTICETSLVETCSLYVEMIFRRIICSFNVTVLFSIISLTYILTNQKQAESNTKNWNLISVFTERTNNHYLCVLVPFKDRFEELVEFVPQLSKFLGKVFISTSNNFICLHFFHFRRSANFIWNNYHSTKRWISVQQRQFVQCRIFIFPKWNSKWTCLWLFGTSRCGPYPCE